PHALYHPASLDFHCLLPCAHSSGNLFVQHTTNDELHYFELARRQQIKKLSRLILFRGAAPLVHGASQRSLNALKQLVGSEWLRKKIHRACFHRLCAHRDVAMSCDKYKLFLAAMLDQS